MMMWFTLCKLPVADAGTALTPSIARHQNSFAPRTACSCICGPPFSFAPGWGKAAQLGLGADLGLRLTVVRQLVLSRQGVKKIPPGRREIGGKGRGPFPGAGEPPAS